MTAKNMLLIFIFFLLSCKEDDLPKPTQNGSGTFACKVDGKVYTPKSNDFKQRSRRATLDDGTMRIAGIRDFTDHSETISLVLRNFNGIADYSLEEEDISHYGLYSLNNERHYTNGTYTGKVKITHFDRSKKIVSGTFDFKAQDAESKEVVHVSEGRFDLYYDEP
jgi:hypothetical protein